MIPVFHISIFNDVFMIKLFHLIRPVNRTWFIQYTATVIWVILWYQWGGGGQAEGEVCTDPGARTPIGASKILTFLST